MEDKNVRRTSQNSINRKPFEDIQFENTKSNVSRQRGYSNNIPRSTTNNANNSNYRRVARPGNSATNSRRPTNNGSRSNAHRQPPKKGGNQGFPKGLAILLMLLVIILIVFVAVFILGDDNGKENNTNYPQQNNPSQLQKEPVWYEQAEAADAQEINYTPPSDAEFPYYIKVNRAMCCVTVYGIDSNGEYSIPVKAFTCSVGKDNPSTEEIEQTITGEYQMSQNLGEWWCRMVDDTYGQFAYRIKDGYMFHSVPCYEMKKDSLETEEFNKLGEPASLGCVRLSVIDAKWICDNCPVGTTTLIYDDESTPGPLGKPDTIKLPIGHEWSGWDPTDPDEDNPWKTQSAVIEAENINVNVGEQIDVLSKVKAYDTCGNDITSKMTWYGKYTFDVPGTYNVTFKVTDAIGSKAKKTIQITVTDPQNPNQVIESNHKATVPANLTNELTSEYAMLVNLSDGETLLDKKASEKMYPASITKAVALLIMLENIKNLNEEYVIKQETYDAVRELDASVANFPLEVPIKAIDLIHGSFMLSGAEATVTLAENIAGSETAFVGLMNKKAKELGMNSTNFVNATGLHEEEQYSTCADLAIFLKEALKNEDFKKIFTTKEYTTQSFEEYPNGMTFSSTMFSFLGGRNPSNDLEITGGKTGFTTPAGLCLASIALSGKTGNEYTLITGKAPGNYWETNTPNHTEDALKAYSAIIEQ